jgi:membrane protein
VNALISLLLAVLGATIGGVVGPAISWILRPSGNGISLQEIRATAGSGRLVNRNKRRREQNQDDQDNDLLSIIILAFVGVSLYFKWRPWVLVVISLASIVVGTIACFVVFIAWRRRIISGGRSTTFCLVLPFLYASVGVMTASMLWGVPGAPPEVRQALVACSMDVSQIGFDGILYVAYSMLGGFLYLLLVVGVIWWDVALISAIYAAQEARPRFLWKTLAGRMPLSLGWGMPIWGVACSVAAIVLASGKGYVWLEMLRDSLS